MVELKSFITNGSYNTKDDNVKKSTSRYFGISKDLSREDNIQSGRLCERCLLAIILNFLNLVLESLRNLIRFEEFQLDNHRKMI